MTTTTAKARPRKRSEVSSVSSVPAQEVDPVDASRRVFKGVNLPDNPVFALESAKDGSLSQEFIGLSSLPGMRAVELVSDGVSTATLPRFFQDVLGEDQYTEFRAFVDEPDNGINLDVLLELAKFLLEEYTGRPTKRSGGR